VVAAVTTAYRNAGLAVVPSFGELPDHAGTELEYMGLLCREEAEAWERDELPETLAWLEREADFLDQHLGCWFPRFAERVTREDDGIYRAATEATWAFVAHDRGLVAALRAGLAEAVA
jgi:putative dimethyl sulfoxide reductase chaperone